MSKRVYGQDAALVSGMSDHLIFRTDARGDDERSTHAQDRTSDTRVIGEKIQFLKRDNVRDRIKYPAPKTYGLTYMQSECVQRRSTHSATFYGLSHAVVST